MQPTRPETISRHRKSPLVIVFEGLDATGKTTQIRLLSNALSAIGLKAFSSGVFLTSYGRSVRDLFMNKRLMQEVSPVTQLFLLGSAMNHLVDVIKKRREPVILIDRFVHTTYAYHGAGLQIGDSVVNEIYAPVENRLIPGLELIFDMPVDLIASRKETSDRIEAKGTSFYDRVRACYLDLAKATPRAVLIDANRSAAIVHGTVLRLAEEAIYGRSRDEDA